MSTLWLPPLNSHVEYITAIRIEEEEEKTSIFLEHIQNCLPKPKEADTDMLWLCIKLNCNVLFFPTDYENFEVFVNVYPVQDVPFPALLLNRFCDVPERLNGRNIQQYSEIVKDLIKCTLEHFNIFWKLYPIRFLEHDESYNYILEDESGLIQKIMSALAAKANYWMETGLGFIPLCLNIYKHVSIPLDEYNAWVLWFHEKKKIDPDFGKKYFEEIRRVRTMDEIFYEDEMNKFKSASNSFIQKLEDTQNFDLDCGKDCTICLENLGCVQSATKLPCSHIFHKTCIIKWLRQSHMCPVCRFALPISFSGY